MVDKYKLHVMNLAEYYLQHFTMNPAAAGFIEVIFRSKIQKRLRQGSIVFIPTGLCNGAYFEIEPNYFVKFLGNMNNNKKPQGDWI